MPTRVLGKTGARISILAFGAGSRFLTYTEKDHAIEAATKSLDMGETYIDTADNYGKRRLSERRIGIEVKGGPLDQIPKLRDQKVTRFIGITSHADPAALKTALERHDFDCRWR